MGGCHPNNGASPSHVNHRTRNMRFHNDNDYQIDEESSGTNGARHDIRSLIRVGSRVLKPSKSPSLRLRLKPEKMSNYNHVNELVGLQIRDMSGCKINGGVSVEVGVVGLRNLGNTCFMNSSLQCLSNTIPLTDYFLGFDYKREINRKNFLGTKGELASAYANLLKKVWLGKETSTDPHLFKNKLEHFAPQFQGNFQHDAQEFLAFLLDGIHEDLNRVYERPYIEEKDCDGTNDDNDSMLAWQNYLRRNKSIIVDLFQGQLKNTLTCRNEKHRRSDGTTGCGHKSVKFEAFMYLSLPISEDTLTLDDCMTLFCREEYLTGDDRWYCSRCKERVVSTKKFDLWTLPPILIIHLKRFKYTEHGARSKINTKIRYPLNDWNLKDHVKSSRSDPSYFNLYATSNHVGDLGSGHYTAHALNRVDEEWYEFNDARTRRIPLSNMHRPSGSAYCMFYNRSQDLSTANSPGGNSLLKASVTSTHSSRTPVVRRQTMSRPELWPHMQVTMDNASNHECFKNFKRSRRLLDSPDGRDAAANEEGLNMFPENDFLGTGDEKKDEPIDHLAPTPF